MRCTNSNKRSMAHSSCAHNKKNGIHNHVYPHPDQNHLERLLRAVDGEMSRQQIQVALGLKGEEHFRKAYLKPALIANVIEMTLPDTPRISKQRYRLTALGLRWLAAHSSGTADSRGSRQ